MAEYIDKRKALLYEKNKVRLCDTADLLGWYESLRVFTSLYESLRVFTSLYESLRVFTSLVCKTLGASRGANVP
jgi:hypothetical protein